MERVEKYLVQANTLVKSIRNHREMMICLKANEKKEKEK